MARFWNPRFLLLSLAVLAPAALGGIVISLGTGAANASLVDPDARIEAAFALVPGADLRGSSARTPADCARATWPKIPAACLTHADGSPAHDVRVVSIAY